MSSRANPPRSSIVGAWATALVVAFGCMTPEEHREAADAEVYALIDSRRDRLFSNEPGFNIEPPENSLRQRILRGEWTNEEPLTLLDCLEIAAENNRDYQTQKERLYLVALDLTLERWQYDNQYSLFTSGGVTGAGDDAEVADADASGSLTRMLGNGATIAMDLGADLLRVVSTSDGWDAVTDFGLSFTQPLLRGAGERIAKEPLTQAERDLVYEVRSFEEFRRTFAVDVAGQVYDLLQQIDEVANEEANYGHLLELSERNEAMVQAGRLSDIEADQARQDELRSETRLVGLRGSLERSFDNFNLFLGLPIDTAISLDPGEFERLTDEAPLLDRIVEERAIEFALGARLDYQTTLDTLEDAERRVMVAEDALRAGLSLGASVDSTSREGRPLDHRFDDVTWSTSLSLDLPVDMIPERNAYRRSLITLQSTQRNTDLEGDRIRINVRDAIRIAKDARESYVIQKGAVALAERRVESANMRLEAGRASTRDILEAQEDLVDNQNAETAALIAFTLARLALYLELEVLRVEEAGITIDDSLVDYLIEED